MQLLGVEPSFLVSDSTNSIIIVTVIFYLWSFHSVGDVNPLPLRRDDAVHMVFWFRDDFGKPIYR